MKECFHNAEKRIIHEGRFIRFVNKGGWEFVERHNCSAIVIIVALTEENRLLFVQQYRPPLAAEIIEFPAGLVSDQKEFQNESIETAAKRELLEETGYQGKKVDVLYEGPVSCGLSSDLCTLVRISDLEKTGEGGGDETESIITHEVPFIEVDPWLQKMQEQGFLIEPKIYTGLYLLKTYNGF